MTVRGSSSRSPDLGSDPLGRRPCRQRPVRSRAERLAQRLLPLYASLILAVDAGTVAAFPSDDTSLGTVLEGITQRYRESIVLVRATRAVGSDPRSLSVLGAPAPGPTNETLWSAGIVTDGSGHVLSCADGAQPTDGLTFVTVDGRELPARFVSQDGRTGLALLALADASAPHPLKPLARCASAAPMRENDWVVLLGPDRSASSLEPRLGRLERILPATSTGGATLLRVDVEGGSGGCGSVVLDGNGDLVGMVVDQDPLSGDAGALEPAVPAVLDEPVWALPRGFLLESALALLSVSSHPVGFLGVQTTARALAEADVERTPIPSSPVEVRRVLPGSPAEQAGLVAGDYLLSVDGVPVQDVNEVSERVSALLPGSVTSLQVLRGGAQLTLRAVIGDRSSLEWLDRRYRRNLRRERLLESEIELLQGELEDLRALQQRLR